MMRGAHPLHSNTTGGFHDTKHDHSPCTNDHASARTNRLRGNCPSLVGQGHSQPALFWCLTDSLSSTPAFRHISLATPHRLTMQLRAFGFDRWIDVADGGAGRLSSWADTASPDLEFDYISRGQWGPTLCHVCRRRRAGPAEMSRFRKGNF